MIQSKVSKASDVKPILAGKKISLCACQAIYWLLIQTPVQAQAAAPLPNQAQTVFRCGNSYGQAPCAGAVEVAVDDSRSVTQKRDSDAVIQRDVNAVKDIDTARLEAEKSATAQALAAQKQADKVKKNGAKNGKKVETDHDAPSHHKTKPPKHPKTPANFVAKVDKPAAVPKPKSKPAGK
jgi:hypothetical protein